MSGFCSYPTSGFDWDAIYNNNSSYGTATNAFLHYLGENIGVSYDCYFTGATVSNAVNYLHSAGYTQATTTTNIPMVGALDYNLRYGYPVIFFGIDAYYGGHMWVCDGMMSYYTVTCFVSGACYDTNTEFNSYSQFLHMNWGWAENYNGWYSYYNFNPDIYDFDSNRILIYNIKP